MNRSRLIFLLALVAIAVIAYFDFRTGAHISMMLLYAFPVLLSAWYCGKNEGLLIAFAATASWLIINLLDQSTGDSIGVVSWNAFNRFGLFALIAYAVSLQAKLRLALDRERIKADTDRLTGMLNKEAFRERAELAIAQARRYNHPVSLAFIDLDNFKQVNDTQGHARGDKLLQEFSKTIIATIRKTDLAGRIGGDEFCIFFPETDQVMVRAAVEKLTRALDIMTSQSGWQVTASLGVVSCTEIGETFDALLGKADKLMYKAKSKGKNNAEFMSL